jgi:hypothetical protein
MKPGASQLQNPLVSLAFSEIYLDLGMCSNSHAYALTPRRFCAGCGWAWREICRFDAYLLEHCTCNGPVVAMGLHRSMRRGKFLEMFRSSKWRPFGEGRGNGR